jgi:acetylornithine deacetylase
VRADIHMAILSPSAARLLPEIARRRDELVAVVADLTRLPSELGHEAPAQGYVADHLRASGLATEVWDLDEALRDHPHAGDGPLPYAGRPNVAGALRGLGGGRSLILNGHIDVVSPEPVAAWTRDPWGAEVVGDRMYGRGAYDMKSGIALLLVLTRLLRELDIALRGDLIVHSVIEEESTGNGALAASLRHRADAALVAESVNGAFVDAHVGVSWFTVTVPGRAAHAGQAARGVNAIGKAMPIVAALEELDRRLNAEVPPAFAGIEHPVGVNVGVIAGGDWPSTVPGACELRCRIAYFPGWTVPRVRTLVEETVRAAARTDPWLREHPPTVAYHGHRSFGSAVSPDEPFVRVLGRWHERVTGEPLRRKGDTGSLDMRHYLAAGVPAGCYGASGGNAHAADEWLDLTSLVPTAQVIGGFVLEWCGVAEG